MSGPPPYPFMPRPGMPPLPGAAMPPPGMMPFPPGGPRGFPGGPPPGMFPGHPPMPLRSASVMRPQFLSTMARPPPLLPKSGGLPVPAPSAPKSTTVYVGKIAPTVDDDFLKLLLLACGEMKSWKRVSDPETKQPKGFGFCEYEDADGVSRAMRLLNNFSLDGQQLLLKPNSATEKYVQDHQARKEQEKRLKAAKKVPENTEQGELVAEETEEQGDNRVLEKIMGLVSDREENLSKQKTDKDRANELLSSLEKQTEKQLPLPPPPARSARSEEHRPTDRRSDHERDRDRDRALEREFERERERERKEVESKKRESDRAYDSKVRDWEKTERDMQKLREREREKQKDAEREHLKAVKADLEAPDTDDELDSWMRKPYRSSRRAEERRKKRIREEQQDDEDREKQAAELAAERERMREEAEARGESYEDEMEMELDQHTDANGHVKEEEKVQPEPTFDTNDPIYQAMIAAAKAPPPVKHSPSPQRQPVPSPSPEPTFNHHQSPLNPHTASPSTLRASTADAMRGGAAAAGGSGRMESPVHALGITAARKNPNLAALFGEEEEEGVKRRKLVPLQYTEAELRAVREPATSEDPKELLRKMMDSIPTNRQGVFGYQIKWDAYNSEVIGKRVSKWVDKKIQELLGLEMPDVVLFIMELLTKHAAPQQAYDEVVTIIDSEAETFVIKLYRMVIYETEKAALGL